MSDTGLTVPGMTEPSRRYDVTITVDSDGRHHSNPAEFAVAAEQAASARSASIVSAHTAEQIISVVSVQAADQIWCRLGWVGHPIGIMSRVGMVSSGSMLGAARMRIPRMSSAAAVA